MKLANFLRTLKIIKTKAASGNNKQQQLSEGFANSCYKIVSPILLQELIHNFVVCKRCSGIWRTVQEICTQNIFLMQHHLGTSKTLFQHKIIFRITPIFFFGHRLECCVMMIYFYCHIAAKI